MAAEWRPERGFTNPGDMLPDQEGFTAVMVEVCRGYARELEMTRESGMSKRAILRRVRARRREVVVEDSLGKPEKPWKGLLSRGSHIGEDGVERQGAKVRSWMRSSGNPVQAVERTEEPVRFVVSVGQLPDGSHYVQVPREVSVGVKVAVELSRVEAAEES